ncbi:zinc finger protein 383-like [Bradysia coprophila]|uniref:zinc finger protein 383-like n=1 Tax=Bradysia coprophila TaxID=38358 RepID=UPI00187D9454|nr:zinc finger protein 383-like [Bradysia coprophila]
MFESCGTNKKESKMNIQTIEGTDIAVSETERLKLSCRLCLAPEQDIPLYSPYQDSIMYLDVLHQLADVQVISNDCLPKKICMECASKLVLFYKFRKKIEISQTTLSTTLTAAMKMEQLDDKDSIDMIEQTIEVDDQYGHDSDNSNVSDMYERGFIALDDVIEETYTEVASDQNSSTDLIEMDNVVEETTLYVMPRKRVRKETKHQCDECGRVFTRKTVLDQHKVTHTGIKNFSCDICNSLFTRRSHLSIHMRIHENSKPYICEICSRGFRKSGDLARHRRIHFEDRNYPCSMCDKRFKRATDVTSHMRTHTKSKPYHCKGCDKKYTSHSSLRKHETRKHEKQLPNATIDSQVVLSQPTMYEIVE